MIRTLNLEHACCIVTFNCDPKRIETVLSSCLYEFDHIFIYCNNRFDHSICNKISSGNQLLHQKVTILDHIGDLGLARAQNYLVRKAAKEGLKWCTFLDQDSVCTNIKSALKAHDLTNDNKMTVFVAKYPNNGIKLFGRRKFYNSSSITINLDFFFAVGGFTDDLFIDWVDFEFCDRVYSSSGTFVELPEIEFDHQLGLGKVRVLGICLHKRNDVRYFYIVRNALYLCRKSNVSYNLKLLAASRLLLYCFFYLIIAHNKYIIFQALRRGFFGKLGPY